jgi:hypothetical protein
VTPELKAKAKELVDRGRHGDQNALALLEEMGKNARAGLPAAQEPYRIVLEYAQGTTSEKGPALPDEILNRMTCLRDPSCPPHVVRDILCSLVPYAGSGAIECACVIICDCRAVDPAFVAAIQDTFPPQLRGSFQEGLTKAGESFEIRKALDAGADTGAVVAGNAIGIARRWQGVRRGAPLAFLSPNIGWELEGS